jgi:hypothetical protein
VFLRTRSRYGNYFFGDHSILQVDIKHLLSSSVIVILLGFLMNMDVLMIHEVVDQSEASMYASIALLAKSLAFIISALEIVLLSRFAQS